MGILSRRSMLTAAAWGAPSIALTAGSPQRAEAAEATTPESIWAVTDPIAIDVTSSRWAVDATGATDSTAGLNAAIAAAPVGATLMLRGEFLFNSSVSIPGSKFLTIDARDATLVRGGDGFLMRAAGSLESPTSVTTVVTASTVLDGQTYSFSRLTLNEARNWARGDVVKVVADDPAPTARYASGAASIPRIGEFATVFRVDGTTVDLVSTLIDAYQTNVRVARLAPGSATFLGGTWDITDGVLSGRVVGGAIRCTNLTQPTVLDQEALRDVGQPVMMRSCFGYLVERQLVRYAMNAPDNSPSVVGYGVVDQGSMHGRARDCRTLDGRHGWTDVAASVESNGDLGLYGRTMLAKIFGAQVTAAGNSGLDTHHGSYGIEFHGATVVGAPGAHTGFGLRGEKHRVVGSTVVGCENAITVFTDTSGSGSATSPESREHFENDLRTVDTQRVLNVDVRGTGHQSAGQRDTRWSVIIDGVHAQGAQQLAHVSNGRAQIRNAVVTLGSAVAGTVVEALNSQLIVEAEINADEVATATDTPRIAYSASSDFRFSGRISTSSAYRTAVGPQPFYCETSTQRADFDVIFEQSWASDNLFRVQEAIIKQVSCGGCSPTPPIPAPNGPPHLSRSSAAISKRRHTPRDCSGRSSRIFFCWLAPRTGSRVTSGRSVPASSSASVSRFRHRASAALSPSDTGPPTERRSPAPPTRRSPWGNSCD